MTDEEIVREAQRLDNWSVTYVTAAGAVAMVSLLSVLSLQVTSAAVGFVGMFVLLWMAYRYARQSWKLLDTLGAIPFEPVKRIPVHHIDEVTVIQVRRIK